MGGKCKYCSGPVEWKNNSGHYREFCEPCANAVASNPDIRARFDPDGDPQEPDRPWENAEVDA